MLSAIFENNGKDSKPIEIITHFSKEEFIQKSNEKEIMRFSDAKIEVINSEDNVELIKEDEVISIVNYNIKGRRSYFGMTTSEYVKTEEAKSHIPLTKREKVEVVFYTKEE